MDEDPEMNNSNKLRLLPHIQQAATFTPNMNAANDAILLLPIRRLLPSLPHEAALSPRARPVVCRRINFSEDELKNVDCLDNSGMDNQDQPIYNPVVLLSTIPPSEMEATTISLSEMDAKTIPPSEMEAKTIPPSEMEAKTVPPSEMEATTIPPSEVTAKQGHPRARQIRHSITRRCNSRNDWVDLSSWQSDEVGGRAEEKTLSFMNSDKQKKN
ncbi:hypothetical protein OUZ56_026204 [Daphnia magna]|uniref:Uncharacterized protein n=1 Tax=Daphnia magna TaxID=35525 RepID=A0ABQ9ZL48_9CRUS|nr:hypothetical protein OUZ56_026204 [Daphnia magna]